MKAFARRDSATALLRKMGVAKTDYDKFITKKGDKFIVNVKAAEDSTPPFDPTPAAELMQPAAKKTPKAAKPAATKEEKPAAKKATKSVAKPAAAKEEKPAAVKEEKPTKKAAKPKAELRKVTETPTPKEGKGAFIRRLISLGYTNAEIWADIVVRYELDEGKKYYPGWYRYDMRRQGFEV